MRTSASIQITFDPGNSIEDAFHDAVEVAGKIGCVMEFKFNEVTCLAYPEGNAYKGVAEYYRVTASKSEFKFAST